jgi:hypothetical protein
MPRRFKPPWTAEQIPGGYVVKDGTGQSLAYVHNATKAPNRNSVLVDAAAPKPGRRGSYRKKNSN